METFEIREIAEDFLEYLEERNLIRTWHRPDLAIHYNDFRDEQRSMGLATISFSSALYALSHFGRKELSVRNGTTIVFRGTPGFRSRSHNSQKSANTGYYFSSFNTKIDSQWVEVKAISDQTFETVNGHYLRKITEESSEYSWIEIEVTNKNDSDIILEKSKLMSRAQNFKLDADDNMILPPLSTYVISVQSLYDVEVSSTELELLLRAGNEREHLIRYLKFKLVSDSELSISSESEDDMQPKRRGGYVSFDNYIPGEKPDMLYENNLKMMWGLPISSVPNEVKNAIKRGVYNPNKILGKSDILMQQALKQPVDINNYKSKFARLLFIEEWKNEQDIKMYDMRDAILTQRHRGGKLLYLRVPGLAEKRPSVLRGDKVYVRPVGHDGRPEKYTYEGYVHHVEQEEVGLGFNSSIWNTHIKNKKYFVRFAFNRLALKLMHRAVNEMYSQPKNRNIIFPEVIPKDLPTKYVKMFNRDIDNNNEQREAVQNIVEGNASRVYVIYGPPGTGKTITMVEVIHQTIRRFPDDHVLVCAPSNSACDLLTGRLLAHVDKREILRMHAASRNWAEVPDDVKDVSNHQGEFRFPRKEELMKCRIIVTTLITAGRIASAEFPRAHFNRIFIDEAGQAMEPEVMIAVAGVLATNGKMVLAGDPKQLGPIIRSSIANTNGLQISFLERLMNTRAMYQKCPETREYSPQCITKLLKNYRSHASIIKVSNEAFYDGELEVCADEYQRNCLCGWEALPQKNFPLIFHGMQGEDKQESTSPSFFNLHEAKQVKKYVDQLLQIRGRKIKASEIGVITPYRKQVDKIKKELKNSDIKVGSVEEFQGQERLVIIISTVRSNTQHLQFDAHFNLGFLKNPKRFNVAVTRAKALLIIIGNPSILSLDQSWRLMLKHCIDNGGYTGIPFNSTTIDILSRYELEHHMKSLQITSEETDKNIEDYVNPQWRQDP